MRTLLVALIAAVGLCGPVLCLCGAVTHACDDAPSQEGCGHEEDCPEDPCGEAALRPRESFPSGAALGGWAPPLAPTFASLLFVARENHLPMIPRLVRPFPPNARAPLPLRI
jgi:hypothetical protein